MGMRPQVESGVIVGTRRPVNSRVQTVKVRA